MGASVYEMQDGDKRGPYHYHHGIEEWMYVVSGAPVHRDPSGERTLEPGDLVAFHSGPLGAHTVRGPGRVVIFSTGARGWGEAFVSVYLDSDKIAASPGVMFRRGDAVESWREETGGRPAPPQTAGSEKPVRSSTSVARWWSRRMVTSRVTVPPARRSSARCWAPESWAATLFELAPGDATAPYH